MTRSSKRHSAPPVATNDRSGAVTSPRIKLCKRRIAIDHPDPQTGERLLADALGAVDRDALHGILKQLVKASASGQRPDAANLAFMISMIKSIAPRDSIEAMLAAQMVCVHAMAMRCAHHLACANDLASKDSASRALSKLTRIFPAQIEALDRYRSNSERAITVESLSVQDNGGAVTGDVVDPARAIVSQPKLADATLDELRTPTAGVGEHERLDTRQAVTA